MEVRPLDACQLPQPIPISVFINSVRDLHQYKLLGFGKLLIPWYYLLNYIEQLYQNSACRERYNDLIKQCQMMHSSIGTGTLAYAVGSKVMDMRTVSKDGGRSEAEDKSRNTSDNVNLLENYCDWDNNCTDTPYACERESSSDSGDLISVRGSTDSAAYGSSGFIPTSSPYNCHSPELGSEANGSQYTESYFDFPPLPVTNLFENSGNGNDRKGHELHDNRLSTRRKLQYEDDHMHSFQIDGNVDLVVEPNGSPSNTVSFPFNCEIEMDRPDVHEPLSQSNNLEYKTEIVNRLRISDVQETPFMDAGEPVSEDRVSEWLWTLHRIGK